MTSGVHNESPAQRGKNIIQPTLVIALGLAFVAGLYLLGLAFEFDNKPIQLDVTIFSVFSFLILLMLILDPWLSISSRMPDLQRYLLLFLLVCLLLIPILESFRLNLTNGNIMFGFVPWSDAEGYVHGGWQMLVDGTLSEWHQRRPINASVMELRLLLAAFNLHALLLWNAVIVALALLYTSIELEKHVGRLSTFLYIVALFGYSQPYLPSTLSEILGFALGLFAFGALLRAARLKSVWLFVMGLALLSFALNARAGTYFMLPAIWLWGAIYLGSNWQQRLFAAGVGALALISGFAYSFLLINVFGSGDALTYNANFGDTIYGLARGGKGWHLAQEEHPELYRGVGAGERATTLFRLSFELIREHPMQFAGMLVREISVPIPLLLGGPSLRLLNGREPLTWLAPIFSALNLIGLAGLLRYAFNRRNSLILLSLIGFLISIPFIYQDGGPRVLSPAMPFVFFTLACGACLLSKLLEQNRWQEIRRILVPFGASSSERVRGGLLFSPAAVLLVLALIPFVLAGTRPQWADEIADKTDGSTCPAGTEYLKVSPERLTYLVRVHPGSEQIHDSLSDLSYGQLQSTLSGMHIEQLLRHLQGPYSIFGAIVGPRDDRNIMTVIWDGLHDGLSETNTWHLCLVPVPAEFKRGGLVMQVEREL